MVSKVLKYPRIVSVIQCVSVAIYLVTFLNV